MIIVVLGEGTKQSSDHVERADAEQEGAAPGGTRDDVMSQVSGGERGTCSVLVGVVCVCVCVCVFGLVEIKRYFFVGGTNEAEAKEFSNSKSKTLHEEKSPEPPSNISGNSLSSSQRTKQAAIPLWPFLDTHFNEMSKTGDDCITHTKSRVNPIVLIDRVLLRLHTIHTICTSETKGIIIHRSFCGAVRNVPTPPHLVALEVCPLRPTYRRPDRGSGLLSGGDTSANR